MSETTLIERLEKEVASYRRLSIDCTGLHADLPQRVVQAGEIVAMLGHPSFGYDARDALLGEMVRLARAGDQRWANAVLSALAPGLYGARWRLCRRGDAKRRSALDAEIVCGATEAIYEIDLRSGRLAARIIWAGYRSGAASIASASGRVMPDEGLTRSKPPTRPWRHPDLVLEEAVDAGVISEFSAELIGESRIQGVPLTQLAQRYGATPVALRRRRLRAEKRLVAWLQEER